MTTVWKIAPGDDASIWGECRQKGCIALGWDYLKDYSAYANKAALVTAMTKAEEKKAKTIGKKVKNQSIAAGMVLAFCHEIQIGDVVVANKGQTAAVGVGIVKSDYQRPGEPGNLMNDHSWAPHARLVEWVIDKRIDDLPPYFFHQNTIDDLTPEKCATLKQAYLKQHQGLEDKLDRLFPPEPPREDEMKEVLEQFRQVILYGPPGTGKTRLARRVAIQLLDEEEPDEDDKKVSDRLKVLRQEGRCDLVVFHPAYEYEQFIGGIAPTTGANGLLHYGVKLGPFLRLCEWARKHKPKPAVLIIDEINRGNLPKLLGELVYAFEYRDSEVTLPFEYSEDNGSWQVPANLYIIATMNSSDRSIGHIDAAIRRRFALKLIGPERAVVEQFWADAGAPGAEKILPP